MNKIWIKMFYNKLIEAELSGSDKEIEKCLEYKKQHLPRYIYKYRSCNKNSFNDLYNNFVHLSYPIVFNDPLDCSSVCTYEQALLLLCLMRKSKNIITMILLITYKIIFGQMIMSNLLRRNC